MRPADEIRSYVLRRYIEPARRRGVSGVRVIAGEVLKGLGYEPGRAPAVCSALKTKKFLAENHLALERSEGPAKMQSVTVAYTYRLLSTDRETKAGAPVSPFLQLRGIAKEVFRSLGGGEAFIRRERDQFHGPGKNS